MSKEPDLHPESPRDRDNELIDAAFEQVSDGPDSVNPLSSPLSTEEIKIRTSMLQPILDTLAQNKPLTDSIPGYEIVREIHRGGQGVVYQAIQKSTKRRVAIKVMREGPFVGRHDQVRFEREVQVLGALNHPSIVSIHDSGTASGCFYYVMDYITGQPLDVWMASQQRTVDETLRMFARICEAVNAAHLRGVIHRDLKPGNIRIDAEDNPHILDFGLAKMATGQVTDDSRPQVMTITGQFVGSLPWASPEQAEAIPSKIDTRTDVYALGVILYQMLTSQFPYQVVGNMRDVLDNIIRAEPARPSTIRKQINDEVETIVLKCLSKERERRYQTAGELARDISRYLAGEPIEAKRDSTLYLMKKSLRRYRIPVVIAASFVFILTGSAISFSALWLRATRERDRAQLAEQVAEQKTRESEASRKDALWQAYAASLVAAERSLQLNDGEGARARLNACPNQLRGWEWRYLRACADTSLKTIEGHTDAINSASFSSDSKRIVTGSADKTAKVWNAATGKVIHTLEGHNDGLTSAAFSADGSRIVTASNDKTAKLWDAETGKELCTLSGHTDSLDCAAFSPDGTRIVTVSERDEGAKIWDAATGKILITLSGERGANAAAFSPDGCRVVTAGIDRTVRMWDSITGDEVAPFWEHAEGIWSVAFSPDGARVAVGLPDGTSRVWDAITGRDLAAFRGHTSFVVSATFSPDGTSVVTASWDSSARVWDARSGECLNVLLGHQGSVKSASFSPDGSRILTASRDRTAKVWDAKGRQGPTLMAHTDWVSSASFSPDNDRIVTASWDGTAKVWNAATGSELTTMQGHRSSVRSCAFSPDGRRIVTASNDKTARIWDVAEGKSLVTLEGHTDQVIWASYSPDGGRVATASEDKTARVFDAVTGMSLITLRGHTASVHSASFSPDGRQIVTASWDKTAKVWQAATGNELVTMQGHKGYVNMACFSSDGKRIVTASQDSTTKMWDAVTGQELAEFRGHTNVVTAAAFSPDGGRVVTTSADRTARIWDAGTGRELIALSHGGIVNSASFSQDGTRIVTASLDKTARIWDAVPRSLRWSEGSTPTTSPDTASSDAGPPSWHTLPQTNAQEVARVIELAMADKTPRSPMVSLARAELLLLAEQREEAMAVAKRAVEEGGGPHFFHKTFGWTLLSCGNSREATAAFKKTLDGLNWSSTPPENADPDHWTSAYFLDLVTQDQYAERWRRDAKHGERFACLPWLYIGQRMEIEGKTPEAIAAYRRSVELGKAPNPSRASVWAAYRFGILTGAIPLPSSQSAFATAATQQARPGPAKPREAKVNEVQKDLAVRESRSEAGATMAPGASPRAAEGNLTFAPPHSRRLAAGRWKASWSPDDRLIVFGKPEGKGLVILDLQNRVTRDLTDSGKDPAWSPDGRYIAFVREPQFNQPPQEVWIVRPNGQDLRKIGEGSLPSWSGDGQVLYVQRDGPKAILAIRLDQPAAKLDVYLDRLEGSSPTLSPDGKHVASVEGGRLVIADAQSRNTELSWSVPVVAGFAAWSRDGRYVAFSPYGSNGYAGIWIVDLVARTGAKIAGQPCTMAAWSNDGRRLAFDVRRGGTADWQVWVVETKELLASLVPIPASQSVRLPSTQPASSAPAS